MFKRILKITGFAFLGVAGVFGIIAGVMAVRGDFSHTKVKPTGLYFSGDEKYFSNNKLLISADENSSEKFYFQVLAENEDCNVLGVDFTITSGQDVIEIVNSLSGYPITSGKIGSNIQIRPRKQNGINIGGVATIAATSADGLVPTTQDLTVYVDVPITDITPSPSMVTDTRNSALVAKTKTRDEGVTEDKIYYKREVVQATSEVVFTQATHISHDGRYYTYNATEEIYEETSHNTQITYTDFTECYEDAYVTTLLNGQSIAVANLFSIYPAHSIDPIGVAPYGEKNVYYVIRDNTDKVIANFSSNGNYLVANSSNLTGDIRLTLAAYPTYAKQREAEALISSGLLAEYSAEHLNDYMITREIVVRVSSTTIEDMTLTRTSLSLDLFNFNGFALNDGTNENSLGLIITDSVGTQVNTLYSNLSFDFVSTADGEGLDLNDYFTITDDNSDIPDEHESINKTLLTGSTPLYVYAKMYISRAYLKISCQVDAMTEMTVYVELVSSYEVPRVTAQTGSGIMNKVVDRTIALDDDSNTVDLDQYFSVKTTSVYQTVLYFAQASQGHNLPVCTLPTFTYNLGTSIAELVGYYTYTKAIEFDATAHYYELFEGQYYFVPEPNELNIDNYYTRTVTLNKLLVNDTHEGGEFSVFAVIVRTNYLGQIIDMMQDGPDASVYGEELDLTLDYEYDFNTDYEAYPGGKSAMATSTNRKTFNFTFKLQNVELVLDAKINNIAVTSDSDNGEYYETLSNGSRQYYLRELFGSDRDNSAIKLYVLDCDDYKALDSIIDRVAVSAKMKNADGSDYSYTSDKISDYILITARNHDDDGYYYTVQLLKATPADCYITFSMSVTGDNRIFPTDETTQLDRLVILSSAVTSVDIAKEGTSILTNNTLTISAAWENNQYVYKIGDTTIENGTNFLDTAPFNVKIYPSYSINKTYSYSSTNSSILSVDGSNLTLGTITGTTVLQISVSTDVQRNITVYLNGPASGAEINVVQVEQSKLKEAPFADSSMYEDIIANGAITLSGARVNYNVGGATANQMLSITNADIIVYNHQGENVTAQCVPGKFSIFKDISSSSYSVTIAGTVTEDYYLNISVHAPFAADKNIKLYIHSALSIQVNTSYLRTSSNIAVQDVYVGTTFKLLDSTETALSDSPLFIKIEGENHLLGGDAGIRSISAYLSASNDYNSEYAKIGTSDKAYGSNSTDTDYTIALTNDYVDKFIKFKIDFIADTMEDYYYYVYVNNNLRVDYTDTRISNGEMDVYCGFGYNLTDLLKLYQYSAGTYTNYNGGGTEININDYKSSIGWVEGISCIEVDKYSNDIPITVGWISNTDTSSRTITYAGIGILELNAKSPLLMKAYNPLTITAQSVISYHDIMSGTDLRMFIRTQDIELDTNKDYYNNHGVRITEPNVTEITSYYELVDESLFNYANIGLICVSTGVLNTTSVKTEQISTNNYLWINTNVGDSTTLVLKVEFEYENKTFIGSIDITVVPNLPDPLLVANRISTAGEAVDLMEYINTAYSYQTIEAGAIVDVNDGEIVIASIVPLDNTIALVGTVFTPTETGQAQTEYEFTLTTDFGYSEVFSVFVNSATRIDISYPTPIVNNAHGYEQVLPGQTVVLTQADESLGGFVRVAAYRYQQQMPLTISYSYLASRDDEAAASIALVIDNDNGTVTFPTAQSAMFAVTLTEAVSGLTSEYFFYLCSQSSSLTFESAGSTTILVDKDHTSIDIASVATVMDGSAVFQPNGNSEIIRYSLLKSTNNNVELNGSILTLPESNEDESYIVCVYNDYYLFGNFTVHTKPNIGSSSPSITDVADGASLTLPTLQYNGEDLTITAVSASGDVAAYLGIDGIAVTKNYVPADMSGYISFTVTLLDAENGELGSYIYTIPITLTVGDYFATDTPGHIQYSDAISPFDIVGGAGETLNLAYGGGYLLIDDTLTLQSVRVGGVQTSVYGNLFTEENNVYTFLAVPQNTSIELRLQTSFGMDISIFILVKADIGATDYTLNEGTGINPYSFANNTLNRSIDLADYISVESLSAGEQLFVSDNFNYNIVLQLTPSDWTPTDLANYIAIDGTTLYVANLTKGLNLRLVIKIRFNNTDTQLGADIPFYFNITANYAAQAWYAFGNKNTEQLQAGNIPNSYWLEGGLQEEYVESGDTIAIKQDNYLAIRPSADVAADADVGFNTKRMAFNVIGEETFSRYDEITDNDHGVNGVNEIACDVLSRTSPYALVTITTISETQYLTFNNGTNFKQTVVLSLSNNAGLNLTISYVIYPAGTLDSISSQYYNGKQATETNDHDLLQPLYLSAQTDDILLTKLGYTNKVNFNYAAGDLERSAFFESLKMYIDTTDFALETTNDEIFLRKLAEDSSFAVPQQYSVYFYSRAGYLGQYNFTFTAPIYVEEIDPANNYFYGSQSDLTLLGSYLNVFQTTYEPTTTTNISEAIAKSQTGLFTVQLTTTSQDVTISTTAARKDQFNLGSVGSNTAAVITANIYYDDLLIYAYDYNIIIQDHLVVSLGAYSAYNTTSTAYLYLGDYYFAEPSRVNYVDIDLVHDNADHIYFTLHNMVTGVTPSSNNLVFTIDTEGSWGIFGVSLSGQTLRFTQDFTQDGVYISLNVKHTEGENKNFKIYVRQSVKYTKYIQSGATGTFIYDDASAQIRSLDTIDLSSTTNAVSDYASATVPGEPNNATNHIVMSIYQVKKNQGSGAAIDDMLYNALNTNNNVALSMSYALYVNEEELLAATTGYKGSSADYHNLIVTKDGSNPIKYSITAPGVADKKILAIKVEVELLGGVLVTEYYFIWVYPCITIEYSNAEQTNVTYTFNDLDIGASVARNYVIFKNDNLDVPLKYTKYGSSVNFANVMETLIFGVTNLDNNTTNGIDDLEFAFTAKYTQVTNPQSGNLSTYYVYSDGVYTPATVFDQQQTYYTRDDNAYQFSITVTGDDFILVNEMTFDLYIMVNDSSSSFGLDEGENFTYLSTAQQVSKAASLAIFHTPVIIRPNYDLDIIALSPIEVIDTINTQSDLGLPVNYNVDFVLLNTETLDTKVKGMLDIYAHDTNGIVLADPQVVNSGTDHWSVNSVFVTVTSNNYQLTHTFTYLLSDSDTFASVDYSTYIWYLSVKGSVVNGLYGSNVIDLKNYLTIKQVDVAYGANMNEITVPADASDATYIFAMNDAYNSANVEHEGPRYYQVSNLSDIQMYKYENNSYTPVSFNNVDLTQDTVYARVYDGQHIFYYEILDKDLSQLYTYDNGTYTLTTDTDFVSGTTYYALITDHFDSAGGVLTVPYEALDRQNYIVYTFNVTASYNSDTYYNTITVRIHKDINYDS